MRFLSYFILILSLFSCSKPAPNTLVIGTIAGPETELVETARHVAEHQYGLHIKLVEFNDYNLPNEALQDGSLDANVYQHLPYLKTAMLAHNYTLQPIGKTFVYPMGIYSTKYTSLKSIPKGSIIALLNDPSNETRALLLLQKSRLITLKSPVQDNVPEIENNPRQLKFKEMDAAQLPRILPDVAAAVINTTFALPAGLSPTKDALLSEGKDSLYANIIVTRQNSDKKEQLKLFVKAFNSPEVQKKAHELFGDGAISAW